MLSKSDFYVLVGLTAAGINKRRDANLMQDELEAYLKKCGVSDSDAYNWAGELVYNEGDDAADAAAAVGRVLTVLDLEVEAE